MPIKQIIGQCYDLKGFPTGAAWSLQKASSLKVSEDHFGCHNQRQGHFWHLVEVRNAGKHPIIHRKPLPTPPQKYQELPDFQCYQWLWFEKL